MVSMNTLMRDIRSFFLRAAMLATVAVAVHAIEPETPPAGPDPLGEKAAMCHGEAGCEGKERMCGKKMKEKHDQMAAELKLDAKQRELFDDATGKMHSGMKDGMSLRKAMKALVHSDDYSEQKARELVRKHHAEQESQMVAAANAMHAFVASLSPEQKARFKAMKDEMHEKMKAHMQSHKPAEAPAGEQAEKAHDHKH